LGILRLKLSADLQNVAVHDWGFNLVTADLGGIFGERLTEAHHAEHDGEEHVSFSALVALVLLQQEHIIKINLLLGALMRVLVAFNYMTAVDASSLARGFAECNTHLVVWVRFSFDHILRVVHGSSTGRQTLTSLLEHKSLINFLEELQLELIEIILVDEVVLLWRWRGLDANNA
jgi:hypothetical protein